MTDAVSLPTDGFALFPDRSGAERSRVGRGCRSSGRPDEFHPSSVTSARGGPGAGRRAHPYVGRDRRGTSRRSLSGCADTPSTPRRSLRPATTPTPPCSSSSSPRASSTATSQCRRRCITDCAPPRAPAASSVSGSERSIRPSTSADPRGKRKPPPRRGLQVVGDTGIEPVTSSVSGKRATNCANRPFPEGDDYRSYRMPEHASDQFCMTRAGCVRFCRRARIG